MGYRGHVRTVNQIEYGASSCSNAFELYSDLIYHYKEENDPEDEMYVNTESEEWEFETEQWEKLVNYFNNLSQKEKEEIIKKFDISLKTLDYAIEDFNGWLEDGKKAETGYITVDWF